MGSYGTRNGTLVPVFQLVGTIVGWPPVNAFSLAQVGTKGCTILGGFALARKRFPPEREGRTV